jgi:hypothetical protein
VTSISTSIIIPICGAARPGITISSSSSFPPADIARRTLPSLDMGDETFGAAVIEHLESGNAQQ